MNANALKVSKGQCLAGSVMLTLSCLLFQSLPALAETGFLRARNAGSQINIRTGPSVKSRAPHYGLPGDRVGVFGRKWNEGYTWYYVKFPISQVKGWVRGDLISVFGNGSSGTVRRPVYNSPSPIYSSPGDGGLRSNGGEGSVGGGCVYFPGSGDSVCN